MKRYTVVKNKEQNGLGRRLVLFAIRWALTAVGLWVSVSLFGDRGEGGVGVFLLGAVIFSLANVVVKPFLTLFSLPVILLTMGLFVLVVNGLMVWLTVLLMPELEMGFWGAVLSGIVMAVVNYLVNVTQQKYNKEHERR